MKNIDLEEIKTLIKEVKSCRELCKRLNINHSGGSTTRLKNKIIEAGIDISHWTGQKWSKGSSSIDDARVRTKPADKIFTENSNASASYVRKLILKHNLIEYICQSCNNEGYWNNEKLNLQLDHINGIREDQRLENLRWLCPNCHSQTETYCSKNSNKKKISDQDLKKALSETENIHQALKKVGLMNGRNYKRAKNLLGL